MTIFDTNVIAAGATSQYLCTDINSIAKISNGQYLCASSEGLFLINGTQDDGVDISSYFLTAMMDFGIANEKRVRFVYVGYEALSSVTMTISTELGLTDSYVLPATLGAQSGYRVTISRSLRGRYWQIKFSGASFAIDEVSIRPIVRGHNF